MLTNKEISIENLESKIRESLNKDLPINWELFWKLEDHRTYTKKTEELHKKVIDLFLHLNIFSLEQDGNIVLRFPDVTSPQSIGNPRHYEIEAISGRYPLFFTRDRDALEYIKAGERLGIFVKGYQAQRIHIVKKI